MIRSRKGRFVVVDCTRFEAIIAPELASSGKASMA
jgi:hypothetical protein